jgi:uncharacterized protein (TIGR03085 family)
VTSLATAERAELSDLLDRLGPNEPTLCAGWNTRDLAAHLVVRESRVDASVGIVVHALAGYLARVQRRVAAQPFDLLVARLRNGPPRWSPYRIARLGEPANNVEFFVHHEDVRRAQADWKPRIIEPPTDDLLWRRTRRIARFALRSAPVGVELVRSDTGERCTAKPPPHDASTVTVTAPAQELLLYLFGRYAHARVDRDGPAAAFNEIERH